VPGAIAAAAVLLIAGFVITRSGSDGGKAGEIFLEPAAQQGPAPFTPTVAAPPPVPTPTPDPQAPETTRKADSTAAIQAIAGSQPGLYGGTRNNSSCDKGQLTTFLQQHPDKAAAFASVEGINVADIPAFIAKLTPVVLRGDTRVTNHGFANGKATPRQTVLQAGSAVLADDRGVPRVRCACGNPLAPPVAVQRKPTYTGKAWPGFSPTAVAVVQASPQPMPALVLADPVNGSSFARPVGTDGAADGPPGPPIPNPLEPPATTTTAAAPTTTARATNSKTTTTTGQENNVPPPNADATGDGTVTASSTFSPEFAASRAVDGDTATSWFSKGQNADDTVFLLWEATSDDLITEVRITGNAAHADPSLRNGTGFGSVTVAVVDDSGDEDFSETVQLPGTPDPDVVVRPGVKGRRVRLTFRGQESPSRGGISELKIGVTR
jgi:hypothetical protein